MAFYEVFGGVLQSDIDFPELRAIRRERPTWTLRHVSWLAPLANASIVGEEELVGGVSARLERGVDRYRLHFDDSGTFDLARGGASIGWSPAPNASPAVVRADVLGRVLSLALHAAGDFCLHASAIAMADRAIAFIGPKGYGKSTLAMALVSRGGQLVADDTVRVTGTPARIATAVPSLRLRRDSAAHFGIDDGRSDEGDKVLVNNAPTPQAPWLPLDAVYTLSPHVRNDDRPPVTRRELTALEATLTLVGHGKIASLLGGEEAGAVVRRAGDIARQVPVYALHVARDLSALDDIAWQIAAWHCPEIATPCSS